jgi:hypothetical protein
MDRQETQLIRDYGNSHDSQCGRGVIRDHARLMKMPEGRAEDALDLWLHLLTQNGWKKQ